MSDEAPDLPNLPKIPDIPESSTSIHTECLVAFLSNADQCCIDEHNMHQRGSHETINEVMGRLKTIVRSIRHLRQQQGLGDGVEVEAFLELDATTTSLIHPHKEFITVMAKLRSLSFGPSTSPGLSSPVPGGLVHVVRDRNVDVSEYNQRLTKQLEARQRSAADKKAKLSNPGYVTKAKPSTVQETRDLLAEDEAEISNLIRMIEDAPKPLVGTECKPKS